MLTRGMDGTAHCERCDADVVGVYRFPRIRTLAWVYAGFGIPAVAAFPFFAWDYVVSLPAYMLYLLGFSQVISILREKPTCPDCGALSEPLRPSKTGA